MNCTYHTNGVLYDTVGVLITIIKVIKTPTVPYNTPLVWYAHFINLQCIVTIASYIPRDIVYNVYEYMDYAVAIQVRGNWTQFSQLALGLVLYKTQIISNFDKKREKSHTRTRTRFICIAVHRFYCQAIAMVLEVLLPHIPWF